MTGEPPEPRIERRELAVPGEAPSAEHPPTPDAMRAVVGRLSRPHPSGGAVIERADILAAGSDASAILAWIAAHGGRAEEQPDEPAAGRGLYRAGRSTAPSAARHPRRYVMPAGCL